MDNQNTIKHGFTDNTDLNQTNRLEHLLNGDNMSENNQIEKF